MNVRLAWLAVIVGALGCHEEGRPASGDPWPDAWALGERQFVLTSLTVPGTSGEAKALGFDLDRNGTVDNQLGNIAVAISGFNGWSPQGEMDAQLARGDNIILLAVYASESRRANAWTFLGVPQALTDGPQPGATFEVDLTNGPSNAWLGGILDDDAGDFGGYNATAWVRLGAFGDAPIELKGARITFDLSADGERLENGRLAGAIPPGDVQDTILPALQASLDAQVRARCSTTTGTCTCDWGSGAETIQSMFDYDGDCVVTLDEVQGNNIIKALIVPDVTLPTGDAGLSVALGFTAVRAVFDHPAAPAAD